MKNFLLVFLMFLTLSSFAVDSVDENKNKKNEFEISNFEFNTEADAATVYCYVTIRNTVTGETRKVYGIGNDLQQCGRNAYALASIVVDNLNNQ